MTALRALVTIGLAARAPAMPPWKLSEICEGNDLEEHDQQYDFWTRSGSRRRLLEPNHFDYFSSTCRMEGISHVFRVSGLAQSRRYSSARSDALPDAHQRQGCIQPYGLQ
jgi:hypothetical protein